MAILVSPGVSVTITDESQYASAGTGTIPLIAIVSAANKVVPGSSTAYAPGTLAANANQLYLVTSQRDLLQTFGTPVFYSAAGTPQYDNQLNELGLFTAYQYLGIANTAYILRADVDLGQMVPSTTEPTGEPATNQYWLDTATSTYGVFQSNGNVNSALSWSSQTPVVLDTATNLDRMVQGGFVSTSGSADIITTAGSLVINGAAVAITATMSISDVASAINNSSTVALLNITATVYVREGKPVVTASAIDDMYYLRLICTNPDTAISLSGSTPGILTDLALTTTPNNVVVPSNSYGTAGSYAIVSYADAAGTNQNSLWQKITQTTLYTSADWWFKVGSTNAVYPGWGWTEASPRVITGTVANPTFTAATQCTIGIGSGSPVTITLTGTSLDSFITDINNILDANSFNAFASKSTVGSSNYLVITNYGGSNTQFNDISTQTGLTHPWRDAGILPTQTYYGSVTGTVANPTFVAAHTKLGSAVVAAPGTGYAVNDLLTFYGSGTYSQAAQVSVSAIQAVGTVTVSAGGSGYLLNDTLTFSGVNYTSNLVLRVNGVSGTVITSVAITSAGQYTSTTPTNPLAPNSTSGNGVNANFTISWGIATVSVTTPGDYTVNPTNPVTLSGGSGASGTVNATMAYLTSNTFTIDPGTGVATTINVPALPNNTLSGVVAAINAAFPSGPIVASIATGNYLTITNTNGTQFTLEDVSGTPLNGAGIQVGYVYGRQLVYYGYYPSLTVPSTLSQVASTNVWINTTYQDRGANYVVKKYNGTNWVQQNTTPSQGYVPMYSSDAIANAAFGGSKATNTLYVRYNSDGDSPAEANHVVFKWDGSAWVELDYTASTTAPTGPAANGTLWYNTDLQVDIMVGNGQIWQGYKNRYPATDPNGPIISGTEPTAQSDGTDLTDNDIWLDSASTPYPVIYRYDSGNGSWILVDNTDHSSPGGIIFTDARWNSNGYIDGSQLPSAMVVSDYVDSDAPNAELYPSGMLLFNTRYSTYNVKEYAVDYFPNLSAPYDSNTWVTASGNRPDGTPYMGPTAQRQIIVAALQAALTSNEEIRAEAINYNLIATPGYIECIDEMITLNTDRKETAFVVADPPADLAADGTTLQAWATNINNASQNGIDGLISSSPYAGVYYPWALATNLDGAQVLVPASEMALRTIAYNDQVAYPWFAPAGFNRGLVTGVTSVGYLKADGTFQPVSLNQGQRDVLYVNRINPIAYIPGRGLVVYGQKTLSPVASALDRINVARLINYMKYQLDNLAKPFLFEPNDQQTRQSVTNTFNSFMGNLVGLRALYDFAVVCDDSNNTPTRIDANELWIDIAIKPEKAIEFIYIPIRILNTGDPMPGGNRTPTR